MSGFLVCRRVQDAREIAINKLNIIHVEPKGDAPQHTVVRYWNVTEAKERTSKEEIIDETFEEVARKL